MHLVTSACFVRMPFYRSGFPRPWGEGQGERIKLIPHFVRHGTSRTPSRTKYSTCFVRTPSPTKCPRLLGEGQGEGINLIPHFVRYGTSRTPSPTKYSTCFARMPSHTKCPRPWGEGQGEGINLIPHFVRYGTSRTPSPTIYFSNTGRRGRRPLQILHHLFLLFGQV